MFLCEIALSIFTLLHVTHYPIIDGFITIINNYNNDSIINYNYFVNIYIKISFYI